MLGEGRGGIESAFAHYNDALRAAGMEVTCLITRDAKIGASLAPDISVIELKRYVQYDPRAWVQVVRLLRAQRPEVILTHGRRAQVIVACAQQFFGKVAPQVVVLHRPRFKGLADADHVIAVSNALREAVIATGVNAARVTHIPNFMTHVPNAPAPRAWQSPPVIGLLGRLVPEKGVDVFLGALAILRHQGVAVRARIGGSGPLAEELYAHAESLGVAGDIDWLGWVEDNAGFFASVDLFCLPSRRESFGLVMLEAFAQGKPVIATRTSGPCEVIADGKNGWLCDISAEALATTIRHAIEHPDEATAVARQARTDLAQYTVPAVAPRLAACLTQVRSAHTYQSA